MKQHGAHGDAAELDAFVRIRDLVLRVGGGHAIENRGIVLECWVGLSQQVWSPLVGRGKFLRIPLLDGAL